MTIFKQLDERNAEYLRKQKEFNEANQSLTEGVQTLTLADFDYFSFQELKDFLKSDPYNLSYRHPKLFQQLNEAGLTKRYEQEHPEMNGIRFFPRLKDARLSEDEKVRLDRHLKLQATKYQLTDLSQKECEELIRLGMVEPFYRLSCRCWGAFCDSLTISDVDYQQAKLKWNNPSSEWSEDDYFYLSCEREGEIEITSEEDFNTYLTKTFYRLVVQPVD